jgi:hypothetical protein
MSGVAPLFYFTTLSLSYAFLVSSVALVVSIGLTYPLCNFTTSFPVLCIPDAWSCIGAVDRSFLTPIPIRYRCRFSVLCISHVWGCTCVFRWVLLPLVLLYFTTLSLTFLMLSVDLVFSIGLNYPLCKFTTGSLS